MPPDGRLSLLVLNWVSKAEQDFAAASGLYSLDPPILYPACFHAQQAAEKYLKAILTARQARFPKTHSIALLLDLIRPLDANLEKRLQHAIALTPYGVQVRYPGDMPEPTDAETAAAIELAGVVREAIRSALKDLDYVL
ncbi:MAG: HEPN domain-containing protein [Candidatus Hydrogenedentes bacterium]|nr:HEPN domain-containing protein [Candidatus Hydrogenedentota bacterium]